LKEKNDTDYLYDLDVFDVYIQRNSNNKVFLVDFNPFSPTTDGVLYNWNELMSCKEQSNRFLRK
jgi:hypothetical protein